MLLMLEVGEGRWRLKVPVLISDLDMECQMWLKLRLAPLCPWIGTIRQGRSERGSRALGGCRALGGLKLRLAPREVPDLSLF